MGWLTPKYPKSDTPGTSSTPPRRETRTSRRIRELSSDTPPQRMSRADRKAREQQKILRANSEASMQQLRDDMTERDARRARRHRELYGDGS